MSNSLNPDGTRSPRHGDRRAWIELMMVGAAVGFALLLSLLPVGPALAARTGDNVSGFLAAEMARVTLVVVRVGGEKQVGENVCLGAKV